MVNFCFGVIGLLFGSMIVAPQLLAFPHVTDIGGPASMPSSRSTGWRWRGYWLAPTRDWRHPHYSTRPSEHAFS
jgi:hypothetical protein